MYRAKWPNLKFVALTIHEIIGGALKLWAAPGYAHAVFSPKILMFEDIAGFYSRRISETVQDRTKVTIAD